MSTQATELRPLHFLIIDNHEIVLEGIMPLLRSRYPQAQMTAAKHRAEAEEILMSGLIDLVIVEIRVPATANHSASTESGIELLEALMASPNQPGILVFSANIKPLFRLRALADSYRAGFVAVDKAASVQTLLNFVDIALQGVTYLPPEIELPATFASRWMQLLELKYNQALSDRAIARTMGLSDRSIRNYWNRIQDAFSIYDDSDKDVRIQIQLAARQAGLIH